METQKPTILLIEDNPDHAELVLRSFRDHQLSVNIKHVTDGEMALDYLLRQGQFSDAATSPRPLVILLDLRLPKVDGLDVLKVIKADNELRRIPVIVLTTSEAEIDLVRAYDSYANSYLVKPVDFDKFIKLMNQLGIYWLDWNHPI